MQTKTVRNSPSLSVGRAVQAFAMVALFAMTLPFAHAVVAGTLSRLGLTMGSGLIQLLPLSVVVGMSVSVTFCCFACWDCLRT
ncbi:hypothetical protein [Haladaptatus sp. DFWS20]|uniref:hypothetical protein n=1 Tax=Haladaptatus sp. DFWS20 TaxID=3403467 RepID=UPI003EBEA255